MTGLEAVMEEYLQRIRAQRALAKVAQEKLDRMLVDRKVYQESIAHGKDWEDRPARPDDREKKGKGHA